MNATIVEGGVDEAWALFHHLRDPNVPWKEVKENVFIGKGPNGGRVIFRPYSSSGPPALEFHDEIEGYKTFKYHFLED